MADKQPQRLEEPIRYRSAGRWLVPQRYVVGWPDGIVKVGSTVHGARRWGAFLGRGAVLLDLAYFQMRDLYSAESWLGDLLAAQYPNAFQCREDATPYLGNRGGGYTECFNIRADLWPNVVTMARS